MTLFSNKIYRWTFLVIQNKKNGSISYVVSEVIFNRYTCVWRADSDRQNQKDFRRDCAYKSMAEKFFIVKKVALQSTFSMLENIKN